MPSLHSGVLGCATVTALMLLGARGAGVTAASDLQLRPSAAKELAAGKLLVAARGLRDPTFSETVILLAEHSEESAMGLVLNRRTEVSVARLFPNLREAQGQSAAVYLGGPVSPDGVLALLRSTTPSTNSRRVKDDVHVVATRQDLEAQIAAGADPRRFRVYVGYAGWGRGQLERETLQGSWHVFTADTVTILRPGARLRCGNASCDGPRNAWR